jgi:hypothetical protein
MIVAFLFFLLAFLLGFVADVSSSTLVYTPRNSTIEERRRLSNDLFRTLQTIMPRRLDAVLANHSNYLNRLPFPHMVQEGIFPLDVLRMVAGEIPDNPDQADGCIKKSQRCDKDNLQNNKNSWQNPETHGPALSGFFRYLKSPPWIHFLQQLTGIKEIVVDPKHAGGGIHQVLNGGFLKIHADFNRLHGMHRRVNILLYLNEDWPESYGGHLELWSRDMKSCMVRARPTIGQLAIFSSTDFSHHGHPDPLTCPKDRSRRSLALYYYSHDRPSSECLNNNCFSAHMTLFQESPCPCTDPKCANFIQQR